MSNPIFTLAARTRGNLSSSFVFESKTEFEVWRQTDFVELQKKYGALSLELSDLPGLQLGDTCLCYGEGMDELRVEEIRQIAPHKWSFGLSHGCWEEVAKCWKKL